MTTKRLWEYEDPYPCEEASYMSGDQRLHDDYDSWEQFKEDSEILHSADRELNLLIRWGWYAPDDADDIGYPDHRLHLHFLLQRKAILRSDYITVTTDEEPEIRAWLTSCATHIAAIWQPLLTQTGESA